MCARVFVFITLKYIANFTFDWDDQLGYNWKDFVSSMLQHIMNTLSGKELVRMLGFAETVEEKW